MPIWPFSFLIPTLASCNACPTFPASTKILLSKSSDEKLVFLSLVINLPISPFNPVKRVLEVSKWRFNLSVVSRRFLNASAVCVIFVVRGLIAADTSALIIRAAAAEEPLAGLTSFLVNDVDFNVVSILIKIRIISPSGVPENLVVMAIKLVLSI